VPDAKIDDNVVDERARRTTERKRVEIERLS
jgi:hypothetical protein